MKPQTHSKAWSEGKEIMSHKINPAVVLLAMLPVTATRASLPTQSAMKKLITLAFGLVILALTGTEAMAQTRVIDLNTGYDQWRKVKIKEGEQDNEWRVISDTINGAPQPPPATGRPADVVSGNAWANKNPSLAVNFPKSQWISITPDRGRPLSAPPNKFQYAFYFTLPAGFSSPELTMKLSADDHITKITLNDNTPNSTTLFQGSGGSFNSRPLAISVMAAANFNSGATVNVITVEVEDTAAVITGLIVDGTLSYVDCKRIPIKDIPGLTSITFWESTFAAPTQHTFATDGPELKTRLSGPLKTGNSDFESLPGMESYDVFYSNWNGAPNPKGWFITIEADMDVGAPSGGGLNIARVDFNGTGQSADSVASFVALGNNAMPNDVGKAVDLDPNVLTDTTMGNTMGQTQRVRITVGFPCHASVDTTCLRVRVFEPHFPTPPHGPPAVNSRVKATGVSYNGSSEGYTDSNGFVCLLVKRNSQVSLVASSTQVASYVSVPIVITTPNIASGANDCGNVARCPLQEIDLDIIVGMHKILNCPSITLNPAAGALPAPAINTPYSQTFSATGGCSSSFTYSVTRGALPNGLTLGTNGELSGIATQAGTYEFTVTATDSCGCSQSQNYTLTVLPNWDSFRRGMNEFCIWGSAGVGYNSPTQIDNPYLGTLYNNPRPGNTGGVRFGSFGLCYGRILFANDRFAFKYTFNAIPVAVLSYPDVNRDLGITVPGSETRRNVFGWGLSPIGFQLYFRPQSRIKPFINTSGGVLFFKEPIPRLNGARFNFTYDFGGGVQVFRDSRRAFNFGYKYQRISNGGRALNNPGFDGHVFYFGYSIFKGKNRAEP